MRNLAFTHVDELSETQTCHVRIQFWNSCPIIYPHWLSGRDGRKNIWLEIITYGPNGPCYLIESLLFSRLARPKWTDHSGPAHVILCGPAYVNFPMHFYSGALARKARQQSTIGKKINGEILVVTSAYARPKIPYRLWGRERGVPRQPTGGGECHLFLVGNHVVLKGNQRFSWQEMSWPSSLLKKKFL